MLPLRYLLLPLLAGSVSAATLVVDSSTITGVYNPRNEIDSTAPSSSTTPAAFATAVSAAYTAGNGAVWGFNSAVSNSTNVSANVADTWSLAFATNKVLTVGQSIKMRYNNFGTAGSVSSGSQDIFSGTGNEASFTLNFSLSGSALAVNERVLQLGFAVINRTTGTSPVYTVTATLDDNSTLVLSDTVSVGTADTDNTHFGIVATAGRYIKSVTVSATNSQAAIIDDLGFITGTPSAIPEPATYATLAGIGLLVSAAYRRRRS